MLPFSSLFIRQGAYLNFGIFGAIFGAFYSYLHFAFVYAAYSVSEEIFNASFSPRFIRQGGHYISAFLIVFVVVFILSPLKAPTLYSGPD